MAGGGGRSFNFKVVLLGEGCVGKTSCVSIEIRRKQIQRQTFNNFAGTRLNL